MMVSEALFLPLTTGRCHACGREPVKLGFCNADSLVDVRCADCTFGPPIEFWQRKDCGHQGPSGPCEVCSALKGRKQ